MKAGYSLNLDELGIPAPDLLPVTSSYDSQISTSRAQESFFDSLNVVKAFANYLVERNRTKDMSRKFAAARQALDARNYEAERQSEIIIANYARKLENFLEQQKAEMKFLTEKIHLESIAIAEQVRNERERQRSELQLTRQILSQHLKCIAQMQEFLTELENSPELYATENRYYFQVQEDCRVKMRRIQKLLKNFEEQAD